ncbi:MAG: TetR family transcriptional regulator [Verrucomicrobiota bacterium]|jgi:TetR/AcrR family acrAB operon transcriptional repressor|nr:TetR family transcriptional regulator [Verrucomicrobiota bacterium]
MARRTKAEAELTRRRIIKAALELFAEKGYERATLDDVARRIRLTKGAVYWHFKSKPELMTELVAQMTQLTGDAGNGSTVPDSLESLREYLVQRARSVTDQPDNRKFFRMMARLDWSAARFAPVKRRIHQLETSIFAIIERTLSAVKARGEIRESVDIPVVTEILGGLWLGLLKVQTDKCMETELSTTMATGVGMVIDAIKGL